VYGALGVCAGVVVSAVFGASSANDSVEHSAVNEAAVIIFSSMRSSLAVDDLPGQAGVATRDVVHRPLRVAVAKLHLKAATSCFGISYASSKLSDFQDIAEKLAEQQAPKKSDTGGRCPKNVPVAGYRAGQ
jgi:hypothetical protein